MDLDQRASTRHDAESIAQPNAVYVVSIYSVGQKGTGKGDGKVV